MITSPGVADRVGHDVRDVLVDQGVRDLPAPPGAADHAGPAQHPQVLGDQRLGAPELAPPARARSVRRRPAR